MSNGYAELGGVPVEIRDSGKEGEIEIRQCWTSSANYVELCVFDPDRGKLYLMDMTKDDARKLAGILRIASEEVVPVAADDGLPF